MLLPSAPPTSTTFHRPIKASGLLCRIPPSAAPVHLSTQSKDSSGSCRIPACPSSLRRRLQTRRTTPPSVTDGQCISATFQSLWFYRPPEGLNRNWWTRDIQSQGLLLQVRPVPRIPSAMSQSSKSQGTSAMTQRFKLASRHLRSLLFCTKIAVQDLVTTEIHVCTMTTPVLYRKDWKVK